MFISNDFRKHVAALLLSSSFLAGCTSGPGTSFTRFWPEKRENNIQWEEDEALAAKWRDRMRETAGEDADAPSETTLAAHKDKESEVSRFRLFKNFRKNKETEPADQTGVATADAKVEESRNPFDAYRNEAPSDPFLQAERRDQLRRQQEQLLEQQLTQKPVITPAQPKVAAVSAQPAVSNTDLPEWGRDSQSPVARTTPTATAPVATAQRPLTDTLPNEFSASFDQSLKNLQNSVAPTAPATAQAAPVAPTAPSLDPLLKDPFAELARQTPQAESMPLISAGPSQNVAGQHPLLNVTLDELKSATVQQQPVATASSAATPTTSAQALVTDPAEHQRALAALEVSQLMKRSRIQARAGEFDGALQSAVEAEQLASSAQVRFAYNEQTPLQLISWLKIQSGQIQSPVIAKATPSVSMEHVLAATPVTAPAKNEEQPELPQWPGRAHVTIAPAKSSSTEIWSTGRPVESTVKAPLQKTEYLHPVASAAKHELPDWNPQRMAEVTQPKQTQAAPQYVESTGHRSTEVVPVSRAIYNSENLRWARLEEAEATLIPGPPNVKPDFVDDETSTKPSAKANSAVAPPAPQMSSTGVADQETATDEGKSTSAGLSLSRVALLLLSLVTLGAAIFYRRRYLPLQSEN